MSRVKIKFPAENPLFQTTIPIRIGDVNYGGHVGNDAILSIVHEARVQMLAHFDCTEMDAGGVGLIMADVMIAYKGESFYKDVLEVEIYAVELSAVSFDLLYRIKTTRNDEKTEIAHAKTGMVCFDYSARKVTNLPAALKSILESV
ncbi:MAG: acyl-CoA thioesterase [Chitinophagales bacterium]|nr:acyl-CoA thioesterase [Chitinophagales bacterium]